MPKERLTQVAPGYRRSFLTEGGKSYRKQSQDISPVIEHVKHVKDMHSYATKASNPNEWRHVGTIPMTLIVDWCQKNGYTFDQWASNAGGRRGYSYPESKTGVRDKFLAYFLSRDFAKLHNAHVTTKRESSQILMPGDKSEKSPRA
jgi:hypothetical protein